MRKRVAITGAGVISSLGDSPASLHAALCTGQTGIRLLEEREFTDVGCRHAANVASFDGAWYLQGKPLRSLDRTSQLTTAAAKLALESGGWLPEAIARHEIGLVLGTMFGSVHTISQFDRHALTEGPSYVSPLDFANTVINAAAGQTAIWHNLRGMNSTIACGTASGLMALGYATDLIRRGQCSVLLAGGVDEFCFESFCGFERTGLLTKAAERDMPGPPFDFRRNGFVLGEGAALLVLEGWDSATARGATILAEVHGHGNAFDPIAAPNHSQNAMTKSMRLALADAGMEAEQIDCISASANGGICADRNEAFAIEVVFGERASDVPITAIKSMLGEALGASGAFQVTALLRAIETRVLPGIVGLQKVASDLPNLDLSAQPRSVALNVGLVNSAGFDGNACSMLIGRPKQ